MWVTLIEKPLISEEIVIYRIVGSDQLKPSQHKVFTLFWFNGGSASQTTAEHWANIYIDLLELTKHV